MKLLSAVEPIVLYRIFSMASVALILSMFSTSTHAALECAARSLEKPELSQFRQSIQDSIRESNLLRKSLKRLPDGETFFDIATRIYYKRDFSPKDIICIADTHISESDLRSKNVWNTHSGTTVLLSPVQVDSEGTQFGGPDHNVFDEIARWISLFEFSDSQCIGHHGEPNERCMDYIFEKRRENTRQLLNEITPSSHGIPNTAKVFVFDMEKSHSSNNSNAFEAFVASVVTLEALNAPFYARPVDSTDNPNVRQYRIFDPVTRTRLPVTSLVRFVGDSLTKMAVRQLFSSHISLASEFKSTGQPEVSVVRDGDMNVASIWTFPYLDAMSQMKRAFICNKGGASGVGIFELDTDTVLSAFRSVGCPSLQYKTKEVIDLSDSLDKDSILSDKLSLITQVDAKASLDLHLAQLKAIGLKQLGTLIKINKFMAKQSFSTNIASLESKLRELTALRGDWFSDARKLGAAIAGVYTGGASFVDGMKEVKILFDKMPKDSISLATNYMWKNRKKFQDVSNVISNGASSVTRGMNIIASISSASNQKEIHDIQKKIAAVKQMRDEVLDGIRMAAAEAEKMWVETAEEVYRARVRKASLKRNVALILEDAIANKMIQSLRHDEFSANVERCISSFSRVSFDPTNFNAVPVLKGCGEVVGELSNIRNCLNSEVEVLKANVAFETSKKLFIVHENTIAVQCFQ